MMEKRNSYTVFGGKPEGKMPLDVYGRITFKLILNKEDNVVLTGFIWLKIGTSGGLL
jgi:hypothetical protein